MRKVISLLANLGMIALSAVAIYGAYYVSANQVHFVRVSSNSMAPKYHAGDTLILKSKPTDELRVGDIALLPLKDHSGAFYTHRITSKTLDSKGLVTVTTKGDANPIADNWKSNITSEKTPVYFGQLPTAALPYIPPRTWFLFLLSTGFLYLFTSLVRRRSNQKELTDEAIS